jgi:hypothetical protein
MGGVVVGLVVGFVVDVDAGWTAEIVIVLRSLLKLAARGSLAVTSSSASPLLSE